jgi:hypothetical protein
LPTLADNRATKASSAAAHSVFGIDFMHRHHRLHLVENHTDQGR